MNRPDNHQERRPDPALDYATSHSNQRQAGGVLLAVVTVLGVIMILVQGTVFYKAKGSASFVGSEKTKILAQQMAEAGVEENVADLGTRKVKPLAGMSNFTTYYHKTLGDGSYSSQITTVGMGSVADTVDLRSTGVVGTRSQSVLTRLRLKKFLDTTRTTSMALVPETTEVYGSHVAPESTTVPPMNPAAMPAANTGAAYTACIGSAAAKCDVCHLPGGSVPLANVMNINKGLISPVHGGHVGDYVTTDGTCDLYKTHYTVAFVTVLDTTYTIVDNTVYDTTIAIDTAVKVQFLSWK
jgi:hypothetical protein